MVSAGRNLLSTWDGWDGTAQDRFSAQTGRSWLRRRVPGACRAAEGSWSLRQGSATALVSGRHAGRSHRPSSRPFPPHCSPMHVLFHRLFGFFPFILIYIFPVWFSFHFTAIFPIPDIFLFFFFT